MYEYYIDDRNTIKQIIMFKFIGNIFCIIYFQ